MGTLYKTKQQDLTKTKIKKSGMTEVRVDTSYEYNGGIVLDGKHYKGYECPEPLLPEGYELKSQHCGLDLNAMPPKSLMWLVKIT
jgi:hypothetical protein